MKNILLLIFILLISSVTLADLKYNPVQLDQFAMTNQCPDCDLSGAVLTYKMVKNHSQANLRGTNLTGALVDSGANFSQADFSLVKASCLDLGGANLSYAVFKGADMSSAVLNDTDMSGVDLSNAILNKANLNNATLTKADFRDAVLIGASLHLANLYRSNITPEQIQQATTVCDAILPDGTKGKCQ